MQDFEIADEIKKVSLTSLGHILQKYFDDTDLEVVSINKIETMSGINDAISSSIYCFSAETYSISRGLKHSTHHFLVKSPPSLSIIKFFHKMIKPFLFEVLWYLDLAPQLEPLEGGRKNPWPDCYYAYSNLRGNDLPLPDFCSIYSWLYYICMSFKPDDKGLIILQDLRFAQRPYKSFDKWNSMTLPHVALIMKELANFHGRWIRWKNHPHKNDKITLDKIKNIYNIKTRLPKIIYKQLFNVAQKTVSKILQKAGENQNDVKFCAFMRSSFMDSFLDQPETDIFTFCHGDLWCNNILFSYEEQDTEHKQPMDLMLIDFQKLLYGHPAYDLNCFLSLNTDLAFRNAHLMDMLSIYHTQLLNEYLVPEGISYDFETFMGDFQLYRAIGVIMAFTVIPNVLSTVSINEIKSKIPYFALAELKRKHKRELFDTSHESYPKSAEMRRRIIELVHELSKDGII